MKKPLLAAVCALVNAVALAQGTVNFDNSASALGGTGAPVFDADEITKLAGSAFLVQLYAGPDATSMQPVGAAVGFLTGAAAGYFDVSAGSTRTIPTVAPGAVATIQIKAWEGGGWTPDSFDLAQPTWKKYGVSWVFTVKTGGDGSPPSPPAKLVGLRSFSLIPEPSTIALTLVGAAALVLIRRK